MIKNKNTILLLGALIFAIVVYFLAIKKTIVLYSQCNWHTKQLLQASNAPEKIAMLEEKLLSLDNAIGTSNLSEDSKEHSLLGIVSSYCQENGTVLKEFPKAISTQEKNILVETHVFMIQGGFIKLLKLVYCLEEKYKFGKLASLKFEKKKDHESQNTLLTATLYLRNVKKISNEK